MIQNIHFVSFTIGELQLNTAVPRRGHFVYFRTITYTETPTMINTILALKIASFLMSLRIVTFRSAARRSLSLFYCFVKRFANT